jgi:dipeptidyl aminopeptidase/acylaminoacyl peptidase
MQSPRKAQDVAAMPHSIRSLLVCTLLLATPAICVESALAGDSTSGADATPLIPRRSLFGNPEKSNPHISPDGKRLAYLAPVEGVLNIWVGPVNNPAAAKPITTARQRPIRYYGWSFTNRHITYVQDSSGDENWHLYCLNLDDNSVQDLTPLAGASVQFQGSSYKSPDEILIRLNDRDPQFHDIYRVNIATGDRRLILKNERFSAFSTDHDFRVRFAYQIMPDGAGRLFQPDGAGGWKDFQTVPYEDLLATRPRGFDKTGGVLFMSDSRGRNTAALTAVVVDTGEAKLIAENPKSDLGSVLFHPTEKTIEAVSFDYLRSEWQVIDPALADDFKYLRTVADGDFNIPSRSLDNQHWIVEYVMDNGPQRYYLYDRATRRASFLFTDRPALENRSLARMNPVVIKSRDGLDLVSYLSLPPWADRDEDGRPSQPLPMVLLVHGGPNDRDHWGYNPEHQLLTNRGYAVLSVNFRYSLGFGKDFHNAGVRQWGAKMHDDLLDAVDWAVAQKIADPKRVGIMGASYGGYATLVGLTFTPERFACGVDMVGISNLVTWLNTLPAYWQPVIQAYKDRIGDHTTPEGREFLLSRSPLNYVERIERPLLVVQGANDARVKKSESDQIVKALESKRIAVTYVVLPDEGHWDWRPENFLAVYAVVESFLARELGGRQEPIGDSFHGSSITVPVGAAQVTGLKSALSTASP